MDFLSRVTKIGYKAPPPLAKSPTVAVAMERIDHVIQQFREEEGRWTEAANK